jgi:dihydrodipicolinate synthase/N-acetylneuraminate lyase
VTDPNPDLVRALRGVVAVLVAPYADDRLDEDALERIAASVDAAGIHSITALGNTAEVYQLTSAERHAHLRATARGTERAVLIAGMTGGRADVVDGVDEARELGYRLAMVHEPSDPFGDSEGLSAYYREIADRSALPLVLYLRTARLGQAALRELVRHPAIVGVKYARAGIAELHALLADGAGADCVWVNGSAEGRAEEFFDLGITGFTSGIANARPDLALAVHRALVERDRDALRDALAAVVPIERLRAVGSSRFNVSVLKEMLRADGIEAGGVRPPHSGLPAREREELLRILASRPAPAAADRSA